MKPADSVDAFASFVNLKGLSVSQLAPRQGVELMFSFYESVQATGCEGPGGDMLLFQWGTYDWGSGRHFELNITRQFIEVDQQDDDAISQLSLNFRFEPSAERDALGEGSRWCRGRTEFSIVREVALSSAPLRATADEPGEVELSYGYV